MSKKLMLTPTFEPQTLKLKINEFKAFAFIDESQIPNYLELGYNIEIDDEVNNIYYAEYISDDMVNLTLIHDEAATLNTDFHLEYEGVIYDMDEVKQAL